jgi:hypothetical protein
VRAVGREAHGANCDCVASSRSKRKHRVVAVRRYSADGIDERNALHVRSEATHAVRVSCADREPDVTQGPRDHVVDDDALEVDESTEGATRNSQVVPTPEIAPDLSSLIRMIEREIELTRDLITKSNAAMRARLAQRLDDLVAPPNPDPSVPTITQRRRKV